MISHLTIEGQIYVIEFGKCGCLENTADQCILLWDGNLCIVIAWTDDHRKGKFRLKLAVGSTTLCYDEVSLFAGAVSDRISYSTNTLSQRSHLFQEDRYNASRSPTPSQRAAQGYNTTSNRFDSQVMESLESQNDDIIEGLSQKVRMLKDVQMYVWLCWFLGDC